MSRTFRKGDTVLAKWPGSSLYYKGKVQDVSSNEYSILFEEGTEYSIQKRHVKSEGSFSRSPGRSPARKSPGRRSPSRRSPARRGSPSRKRSPGRPRSPTKPKPEIETRKVSPDRNLQKLAMDEVNELKEAVFQARRTEMRERRSTSIGAIRSSERIAQKYSEQHTQTMDKIFHDDLKSKSKDKEDISYGGYEKKSHREFGGWPGSLLIIITTPLVLLSLHLFCIKDVCSLSKLPKVSRNWKTYFDLTAAGMYLGFVTLLSVLSVLPVGRQAEGQLTKLGRSRYRCNGFLSLLVILAGIAGAKYYNLPVHYVKERYIQLMVTGTIFGLLLSVVLYLRGRRASIASLNPSGNTGNIVYDSFMGKEVNPKFGLLDVKIVLSRIGIIGMIVINVALILKHIDDNPGNYSPALLLSAALQIFYGLDFLWFEESFLTSFEVLYEGVGSMLSIGYCLYPFVPTMITRYLVYHRIDQPVYFLAPVALLNTFGYVIFRASNAQKSEFRKNPLNPALAHLETIPTSRGKKLLVSGWWGWVRHPNYLGDIIVHWSWALASGFSHFMPYIVPIVTTLLLLHRARRDDIRCSKHYEAAWDRYCSRVKDRVVPRVY